MYTYFAFDYVLWKIEEHHGTLVGELHLRKHGALRKVSYLPLLLVTYCAM